MAPNGHKSILKGVFMKKIGVFSLAAMLATSAFAADDLAAMKAELDALKTQVVELKKNQEALDVKALATQMNELKTRTGGDNLKWSADYRVSYDMLDYKMADGSKTSNGVLSNRLWLGMKAAPRKDISFIGQLSYNKAFGANANNANPNTSGNANFDWVTNENLGGNEVKVKTLYAIYFGNVGDVDYTASIGRRASTNGTLANLRSDDAEASPNGHMINVEFDGASFNFNLDKVTGVPGMAVKLCMGRGLTNVNSRFMMANEGHMQMADYTHDDTRSENIDMFGFIFTPFDNGQYRVTTQAFKAWNLIGYSMMNATNSMNNMGAGYAQMLGMGMSPQQAIGMLQQGMTPSVVAGMMGEVANGGFENFGNFYGGTISAIATGIGSGLGDFLDNTTAFASYSISKTDPSGKFARNQMAGALGLETGGMLGSEQSQIGNSIWLGVQMPAVFTKDGKIGLEYNKGSKWWRSFTYGEDTMVGSKLAARGTAYEAYYTQPILGNVLSAQLRYTKIDYDYTGSNAFFGDEGHPYDIDSDQAKMFGAVKSASNIMGYLRYRY